MKRFLFLALTVVVWNFSTLACATTNSVSLVSYFPEPVGAYDRLRLIPRPDLTGPCPDNGAIYFKNSDQTLQICIGNTWRPLMDLWSRTTRPGFDPYTGADVDQYYLVQPYPDLTSLKPWLGIGTQNPQSPLHIVVNSPGGTPSSLLIENLATTHSVNDGPGSNISFWGKKDGIAGNEYVVLRAIYPDITNATATSLLAIYLQDGTPSSDAALNFLFKWDGSLGIRYDETSYINAHLSIAGNAINPPAVPAANTLPYLMISTNNIPANNGNILTVRPNGNVGINQPNPTEKLEILGNLKATSIILTSDALLKENITPLKNSLEQISQLNGFSFQWSGTTQDQRKHMGILAQNVEKVFPEAVYDSNGAKSVDYPSLIAPLIEAVKELKQKNQALAQQFQQQSIQIHNQQEKIKSLKYAFEMPAANLKHRSVK